MKEAAWGYLILALGVSIIAILLLVQSLTSTSEEDFYLAREVLEASMYDAIDYGTYAKDGKLVMSEQKFVEVFLRRFAESVMNGRAYKVDFYDIHEYPPKATVVITTSTGSTTVVSDDADINIFTNLTAILETNGKVENNIGIVKGTTVIETEPNNFEKSRHVINNDGVVGSMYYSFLDEFESCGYYLSLNSNKNKNGLYISSKKDPKEVDTSVEYCKMSIPTISGCERGNCYVPKKATLKK